MEKIYFDLFRVRDQLLAMQKLNEKELDLRAKMKGTQALLAEPQLKDRERWINPLVLFGALLILFTVINVGITHRDIVHQYENEAFLDEWAWNMDHQDDNAPYPGYEEKKPNFISSAFITILSVLPVVVGISAVYGATYYVSASFEKKNYERRIDEIEARNEQIRADNERIRVNNAMINDEIAKIHAQKQMISQEYRKNTITWFPKSFGYLSAVDFFIDLAENHIAFTIPEMVDRYLAEMRHQQMMKKQQEMINNQRIMINNQEIMITKQEYLVQQQMIGNMINMANLSANTAAANAAERTAQNIKNIYERIR